MIRRIRWQLLIAGCTSLIIIGLLGAFAVSTAGTTRSLRGRVYVEGVVGEPQHLHPLVLTADSSPAERDIAALLFEGLTRLDPAGRVIPALAERWTVSEDRRIYTFTLRRDRTWHDNVPVTAVDVVYTVRGVQNAGFPGDPELGRFWRNVLVQNVDTWTVRFELSAPFASFPSVARMPILPAHVLRTVRPEQWGSTAFNRLPIGTGPFKLQALDADQALLVPFEGYRGPRPEIDNLLLRFYPTADAALLGLSRREVQGVATVASAGRRVSEPPRHAQRVLIPLGDYTTLTFNLQQQPLDDPQFRRALAVGLNRDLLISTVLNGQAQRLDSPILPGTWAADSTARLPEFRRSTAQQLLGTLGYVDTNGDGLLEFEGQPLSLPLLLADTPEQVALAREIARQLREIGIDIDVQRVPADELPGELATQDFTLALHSWSRIGADPDVYALWHSSQAEGRTNYAGLRDNRIDQLLEDARATTDEARRKQLYAEFQRRWVELMPGLPLYQSVLTYDLDTAITVPEQLPAVINTRADRFAILDRWRIPSR